MNKYLVVLKIMSSDYDYDTRQNVYNEEILNDIIENDKLNEDLFNKIYNRYITKMVCILNVIKLDN